MSDSLSDVAKTRLDLPKIVLAAVHYPTIRALMGPHMVRKRFSKGSFLTVFCLSLILALVNYYPSVTSAQTTPAASQTTEIKLVKEKKPHPVRRLFSGLASKIAGVFRRPQMIHCVLPPYVDIRASKTFITFCPTTGTYSTGSQVSLSASVLAPEDIDVVFTWAVTGGRLSDNGLGRSVTWDLSGVPAGVYTATVEMKDEHEHLASTSTTVEIASSPSCDKPPPPCPVVSVSYPSDINLARPITFEATVTGGAPELKPAYTWSISAGKIIAGQGTSKLTVDGSNLTGQELTATVLVGGADPSCPTTASATLPVATARGSNKETLTLGPIIEIM